MALNDIVFVKGQGGLGRPLAGEDYISGMIFYAIDANLPSGFSPSSRIKSISSVQEAADYGIVGDFSDATASICNIECTNAGSNGDSVIVQVSIIDQLANTTTYQLANYTKAPTETTQDDVATAVAGLINAGTYLHGFSAVDNAGQIDIFAPKRLGAFINGTNPVINTTGALAFTINSAFSGGVNSNSAIPYYHISEFFRIQPKGLLFVMFADTTTFGQFTELQTLQDFAGGKIRQCGIYWNSTFANGDTTTIQSVCNTLADLHKPVSVLYAADISGIASLSALPDLALLNNNNVSVVIGQDGGGRGNYLYTIYGNTISCLGATLGAVALSKVSDDIAWVGKYNISNGQECDTISFGNGTKLIDVSQNQLNLLDNRRYIFLIKYVGIAGSFFNDSHCAVSVTSDYAYIENNRTIDKAIRGVYSSMLPNLNSPLQLNADGTLTDTTIAYFIGQASVNLEQMVRDVELSAFGVDIDTTQNVLSTSTLIISVKLVPIGVARNIIVNIGFTLSI